MIDLHLHSAFSLDGELSPKALIDLCYEQELKVVAITDHNDCYAYLEVENYAKEKDMTLIPGIEIDCLYGEMPLHLLAYGISPHNEALQSLCETQMALEISASDNRIQAINALGFDLERADFDYLERVVITPEDIAEVLLHHKNLPRHPLLLPYRSDGMRSDNPLVNFYWDYFSKGKPCYQALAYPSLESVIKLIHDNGGLAVLAHPGITFRSSFETIHDIIDLGIDAMEVFSSYHNSNETETLYELAKEKNLLITAGSDFHGKIKPSVRLGDTSTYHLEIDLIEVLTPFLRKLNITP